MTDDIMTDEEASEAAAILRGIADKIQQREIDVRSADWHSEGVESTLTLRVLTAEEEPNKVNHAKARIIRTLYDVRHVFTTKKRLEGLDEEEGTFLSLVSNSIDYWESHK